MIDRQQAATISRPGRSGRPAALFLALVLHGMPVLRALPAFLPSLIPGGAILLRWVAGAVALGGAFHSVSGASASISGLTQYQNSRPVGKALTAVTNRVGTAFNYRITVLNPGSDHQNDYFNCLPAAPPGLTINTNVGGTGYISGVPTVAGSYPVRLLAGNTAYPTPVFLDVLIVVEPSLLAPTITTPPANKSVLAGGTVAFSVVATGSAPLVYQWMKDGTAIPGGTLATLTLTNVVPAQQGLYWVVVSNSLGSATSSKANLTVQESFAFAPKLDQWAARSGAMEFRIAGPAGLPHILWTSSNLRDWVPAATNLVETGIWLYSEPATSTGRFYRVSVQP